jgi:uncharacterized protein YecE (DUF72 family)
LSRASKAVSPAANRLAPAPPNLFAGTSGWAYPTWQPGFYPAKLPARSFLQEYAARLTSVEVNYTFRTLPSAEQLNGWLAATPASFLFSFKAPQRITHFQRLRESHDAVAEFVDSVEPVRAARKLGVLLFQLPPNFKVDLDRLGNLLASPKLCGELAPRVAFEFRHPSWFEEPVFATLREHRAALCVAENEDLQTPDVATADFRCYRLRRPGGYPQKALRGFAQRFTALARTGPVFAYFKHEDEPTGALNAEAMLRSAYRLHKAAGLAAGAAEGPAL